MEEATFPLVSAVTMIAMGVALASYGELNLSIYGLTAMIISIVAESIRLVLTQYLLVSHGWLGPRSSITRSPTPPRPVVSRPVPPCPDCIARSGAAERRGGGAGWCAAGLCPCNALWAERGGG